MAFVGTSGVANRANTSPGTAIEVVADAYNGWGDDVGDHGVVVLYTDFIPPVTKYYILMESTGYVLQEDGSKIELESD